MNWKEVDIQKPIIVKENGKLVQKTLTKKVLFPENSVYFTICREIEEMKKAEVSKPKDSSRRSSRRK